MKRAFLILGPESSGTKVAAKLFCLAGCQGDHGHLQRLDAFAEGASFPEEMKDKDIVFRRSVPHGGRMPDIVELQSKFLDVGYNPKWVITVRDWYCNIRSAPQYGHKASIEEETERLPKEWAYIGQHLQFMKSFYFLIFSQMVLDPVRALKGLSYWSGLNLVEYVEIIRDTDERYFR